MHTYIIGHYIPLVRIINLVSHTNFDVCVNFIHKWRDQQFNVDSEQQIFWETFHCNFIYSYGDFFLLASPASGSPINKQKPSALQGIISTLDLCRA